MVFVSSKNIGMYFKSSIHIHFGFWEVANTQELQIGLILSEHAILPDNERELLIKAIEEEAETKNWEVGQIWITSLSDLLLIVRREVNLDSIVEKFEESIE